MPGYLNKLFLYFITDEQNRSYYIDGSGVIKVSSPPVCLPQSPRGWKDIGISFGTNQKYWSLNRTFSVPMFFVGDGADICREFLYSGRGYEENKYLKILKYNPANGIYELEYTGRLDFENHDDEPRKGITVNTIEGGVFSYLTSNDGVQYELPLAPNNPAALLLQFDGVNLRDNLKYATLDTVSLLAAPPDQPWMIMPLPFISNDGDSVGIVNGSQDLEYSDQFNTLVTSANCILYSIAPVDITVSGILQFSVQRDHYGTTGTIVVIFRKSSQTTGGITDVLFQQNDFAGPQDFSIPINTTISLAANEKLFLILGILDAQSEHLTYISKQNYLYFSYKTKNGLSTAYSLPIIDVLKQLVSKMSEGKYTGDSIFFSTNKHILWTSTNALQNYAFQIYYGSFQLVNTSGIYTIIIPGALNVLPTDNQLIIYGIPGSDPLVFTIVSVSPVVAGFTTITVLEPLASATISGTISTIPALKLSFEDFFNDVDCIYNIGMKIRKNVIWIEPKTDLYKPDMEIFDIGEISKFKLHYATDLLCNTGKFGYKSQDYRQRNGVYEYNTTTLFKFPVNNLKGEYTKILKARGDCFGIEFIRSMLFNQPTRDVTGDNQPFVVNARPANPEDLVVNSVFQASTSEMLLPAGTTLVPGETIQITGSVSNNYTATVGDVGTGIITIVKLIGVTVVDETATITIHWTFSKLYKVYRATYTNITGVLDDTVYNIEELTPHRLMLAHKSMLSAILYNLRDSKIVFQTADKNSALSVTETIAGSSLTLAERQDELIMNFGTPLFYPIYGEFEIPVSISFAKVMAGIETGFIKGTFYGQPIYFLPIGTMTAKPALNNAQSWKLMLASTNDLNMIKMLSSDGLFTTDSSGNMIFTTILNSLHFNKYNFVLPPQYHHLDMFDAQFEERGNSYIAPAQYLQKWQKTEKIAIQCITKGLGVVNVDVYDVNGKIYDTHAMTIYVDPSVQLPYVLNNYELDVSAYPSGVYMVVLSSGATNLRISEWIDIDDDHPGTILFKYGQSNNVKFFTYFKGFTEAKMLLRLEAALLDWIDSDTHENYTDEFADNELIDGIPMPTRKLQTGYLPDWVRRKLNYILLLNRCNIESQRYSRLPDSKVDIKQANGVNLASYTYDISLANNNNGLATDEAGSEDNLAVTYTLDAAAFGGGEGDVIHADIPNN